MIVRPKFLTTDFLTLVDIEAIAHAVQKIADDTGWGEVRLIVEHGKVAGVQILTSQRNLGELLREYPL